MIPSSHPPPPHPTESGPWVSWDYPGHYGPEMVQGTLGTAHVVLSCPAPLPHCRLSWAVQRLLCPDLAQQMFSPQISIQAEREQR